MSMTAKKTRQEILSAIRESIMESPKTMYELSRKLDSNWDTIKSNVELLIALGLVEFQDQKVVYLENKKESYEKTYAGLPSSALVKKKVYAIGCMFLKEWKLLTKKKLLNTVLQKALVEVADTYPKLQIPRGWYLYGRVVLVKVTEEALENTSCEYDVSKDGVEIKKLTETIKALASHYSTLSLSDILKEHYHKHDSKIYVLKKEIDGLLYSQEKNSKDSIAKKFYELVFLFDLNKNDELSLDIFASFKDGITSMIQLIQEKDELTVELRVVLSDMLRSVWKLVASYNLYNTYEGSLGYDDIVIRAYMADKTRFYMTEFKDHMSMAQ